LTHIDVQWSKLKKAVASPHSGLTAVELGAEPDMDAAAVAQRIAGWVRPRPCAQVILNCANQGAQEVTKAVRKSAEGWVPAHGVVCVCDVSPRHEERAIALWRDMNLKREALASIDAHIVLLLKPFNYSLFMSEADDLADFAPARIHLGKSTAGQDAHVDQAQGLPRFRFSFQDPHAVEHARDLERARDAAILKGGEAREIAQRFDLPLMRLALSQRDFDTARRIRENVALENVREPDLPAWHYWSAYLDCIAGNARDAAVAARKAIERANPIADREIVEGAGAIVDFAEGRSIPSRLQTDAGPQTPVHAPRLFISSTVEDLRPYREKARDAALEAGFMPVMQEYFAAQGKYPPLSACLQKVDTCDVLAAVVAHRHGWTPPVDGAPGIKSITRLECEQARNSGKDVLVFLVDPEYEWPLELREEGRVSVALQKGGYTPELPAEVQRNMASLQDFKTWLAGLGFRKVYTTPDNLAAGLAQALHEWKERHRIVEAGPIAAPPGNDPRRYLTWLANECGSIEIRGLHVSGGKAHRFDIEDLYTPLYTVSGEPHDKGAEREGPDMRPRKVSLDEVVKSRHTVVIGDPGSGKSTFLRHVAAILCRTLLGEKPDGARDRLGLDKPPTPLFIRVSELATHIGKCDVRNCAEAPRNETAAEWLIHYLADRSAAENWRLGPAFFREACAAGNALLLLDGLDEAPGRVMRERITAIVEHAVRAYDGCTVIVSSRPGGYEGKAVLDTFAHCTIAALEEDGIRTFLLRWSGALYQGDERKAREHAEELMRAVTAKPEIRRMAVNPVMLTALAVLYWNDKRLPDQRVDLYESIITWLLRARQEKQGRILGEEVGRKAYQRLAYRMQSNSGGRLRAIDKADAQDAVAPLMPGKAESGKRDDAARFIEDDELDSGIIVSRGNTVEFWHLTFQEYLAAKELSGMSDDEQRKELFTAPETAVHNPDWREMMLLFVGVMYKVGIGRVNAFFAAMLGKVDKEAQDAGEADRLAVQARCFGLMGAMIRDLSPYGYVPQDRRYSELRDNVMGIFDPVKAAEIDVKVRCAAGDALGRAGDPRIVEDLRTPEAREKMFVEIPAGEFLMGAQKEDRTKENYDEEAYADEAPVHRVKLTGYSIGRYPVTVSQYRRFVEDDGYDKAEYWPAGGFGRWQSPDAWEDQKQYPNRPVVGVSWYEAMAFCAWVELSLSAEGKCRLPTEAQWERAARGVGEDYRQYPWGGQKPDVNFANFTETNIGHPSPVGCFPGGRVVWDLAKEKWLADMAGNVWEWCCDRKDGGYDERSIYYEQTDGARDPVNDESGEQGTVGKNGRVVRGGSWYARPQLLRCAYRLWLEPEFRNYNIGFRCVCSRY